MFLRSQWPPGLDDATQRLLILRAAKECAPDQIASFRARYYCFSEFDKELRDSIWAALLLCWMLFPLLALIDTASSVRVRRAVNDHWERWLMTPDRDCEMWAALETVRRAMNRLPRRERSKAKPIHAELKHVEKHWADLSKRQATVAQALAALSQEELVARKAELEGQAAAETDPITQAAQQRRLAALEGQLSTRETLETWKRRLETVQAECLGISRA